MYRLQVNLPNLSSCFSNFIKSFIKIFETLVVYICCEIISADYIATGEAARMSGTTGWTQCQDIFNRWCYCFNCRYETLSANWDTLKKNATLTLLRMVGTGSPPDVGGASNFC